MATSGYRSRHEGYKGRPISDGLLPGYCGVRRGWTVARIQNVDNPSTAVAVAPGSVGPEATCPFAFQNQKVSGDDNSIAVRVADRRDEPVLVDDVRQQATDVRLDMVRSAPLVS